MTPPPLAAKSGAEVPLGPIVTALRELRFVGRNDHRFDFETWNACARLIGDALADEHDGFNHEAFLKALDLN